MFGYTEAQIAWFGMTFGLGAFMLYMLFIILQLARESKAGRFGTFVLLLDDEQHVEHEGAETEGHAEPGDLGFGVAEHVCQTTRSR